MIQFNTNFSFDSTKIGESCNHALKTRIRNRTVAIDELCLILYEYNYEFIIEFNRSLDDIGNHNLKAEFKDLKEQLRIQCSVQQHFADLEELE